jgi:hypothetical protein
MPSFAIERVRISPEQSRFSVVLLLAAACGAPGVLELVIDAATM